MNGEVMARILWDPDDPYYGAVMEPESRYESTSRTLALLRSAHTVGELRDAELAPWGRTLLDAFLERFEDEHEESATDDTAWDAEDLWEMLVEIVPVPWDYGSVQAWLDRSVIEPYVDISGASPGGNIDAVTVADVGGLRRALEAAGFELVHHPGLTDEYYSSL